MTALRALVALLVFAFSGAAYAQPAPAEGSVVSIEVEGNRRVEEAAVMAAVQLRPGEQLASWKIQRDIKAVYRTGFFQDVQVDVTEGIVTFIVDENPAVREVLLTGHKKLKEEDIREVLDISPFAVLNNADIGVNQARIRDLYIEKGYFLAEVEAVVTDLGDDQVELTFDITENRKVVVQSVDITGNDGVPDRKIRRYMQTKPGGIAPWLTQSGSFSWDSLDNDVMVLRSVFLEEGYVDATVDEPQVYLSPDKRYIYVTIHVDEGQRYKLGHIRAEGDWVPDEGLVDTNVLRLVRGETVKQVQQAPDGSRAIGQVKGFFAVQEEPATPLETGDFFKLTDVQMAMERIADLYRDQGYAFVNVYPDTITDAETGVVDLTFVISKGEKVRIGEINISGNDPTWDQVVRREIPLNEGDIYNGSDIRDARTRLQRLGFFEEVRITTPRGDGPDVLDMNVSVIEQPTGSFSVGLGFSNLENFVAQGSISKNNFLGLGYVMSASINVSSLRKQGNLSFFDPYFLGTRWTFKVDGYSISQQYVEDQYQRGGGVAIGRYLDPKDDWRLTMDYTLEDVGLNQISPYQEKLFGGELYRNGLTSTLGLNLNVDKRNNRINASKGLYASVSTELSGGFRIDDDTVVNALGGDFMLWENRLNVRYFHPVIPGKDILIFKFNTTLGNIQSTDGSMVPFIHRYRAGGINSVRGYNWYSLGPSVRMVGSDDPTRADDRLVVGGTSTWINNFELEAPIIKAAGISTVLFFDAGNAFGDPYGEGSIRVADLRYSYGFGVRWFSPIGPLRFEWGFPVAPYEDEKKMVFDFSIGSFF